MANLVATVGTLTTKVDSLTASQKRAEKRLLGLPVPAAELLALHNDDADARFQLAQRRRGQGINPVVPFKDMPQPPPWAEITHPRGSIPGFKNAYFVGITQQFVGGHNFPAWQALCQQLGFTPVTMTLSWPYVHS
jgi:hypothetical protein